MVALLAVWKLGSIDSTPQVFLALDELHSDALAQVLTDCSVGRVITTNALDWRAGDGGDRIQTPSGAEDFAQLIRDGEGRAPTMSR